MAPVFSDNVNVSLARRVPEQVLRLDRTWSGIELCRFGSSIIGAHAKFAPGVGRPLRLSAHARLFTGAIWRKHRQASSASADASGGLMGIPKKRRRQRRPARNDRNLPDLLPRDFSATEPNRVGVTDLTELKTGEGKLYLCVIQDLYDGAITAWKTGSPFNGGHGTGEAT